MSEEEKPTETAPGEDVKAETPKEEESTAHFEPVVCFTVLRVLRATWHLVVVIVLCY